MGYGAVPRSPFYFLIVANSWLRLSVAQDGRNILHP